MKKCWDVLGIGAVAVDDLIFVDHYPQPDAKIPVKYQQRQGGGLIATALVTASRLGCKSAYCACLGNDDLSSFTIGDLQSEGVDCSQVRIVEGATPIHSIIIVDLSNGSRTILYSKNGFTEPDTNQITQEIIGSCKVLLVDSFVMRSGTQAAQLAHAYHIPVVADAELPIVRGMDQFIEQVDHLIIGSSMGAALSGKEQPAEMVQVLSKPYRSCTVVTAGSRGCWYAERDGHVQYHPAFKTEVVDSTGCGDVFHGAYATGLALGMSVPEAITLASASAGLKASRPGGRTGIPGMNAVQKFLVQSEPSDNFR